MTQCAVLGQLVMENKDVEITCIATILFTNKVLSLIELPIFQSLSTGWTNDQRTFVEIVLVFVMFAGKIRPELEIQTW
jgi:hypothetical protein